MKFGFVAKHRGILPVRSLCETLEVSRSGFYAPGRHVDPAPMRAAINGLGLWSEKPFQQRPYLRCPARVA